MRFAGWPKALDGLYERFQSFEVTAQPDGSFNLEFQNPLDGLDILTLAMVLAPVNLEQPFAAVDFLLDWADLISWNGSSENLGTQSGTEKLVGVPTEKELVKMHASYVGFEHFFREGPKLLSIIINTLGKPALKPYSLLAKVQQELNESSYQKSNSPLLVSFPGKDLNIEAIRAGVNVRRVSKADGTRGYILSPLSGEGQRMKYSFILCLAALVFLNNSISVANFESIIKSSRRRHHQFMGPPQVLLLICKYLLDDSTASEASARVQNNVFAQLDEILATQAVPTSQDL